MPSVGEGASSVKYLQTAKKENLGQVTSTGTIRLRTAQEGFGARSISMEAGYWQLGGLGIERKGRNEELLGSFAPAGRA
jgi:hypothetical protein